MSENKSVNRMFLLTVVVYIGASLFLGYQTWIEIPNHLGLILSEALIFIPALWYYSRHKNTKEKSTIPFHNMKPGVWVLVIVCTYLMYPLLIVLNALTLFFVESGTVELMDIVNNGSFFAAALLMAVMPAFVEEFVFRGVLFQTYRKSKMLPGIFLSAFLFGCMHMNFNQFLYAFVLGIYMAFLVEATGSILSSMLAHFTINFTSVAMSYGLSWFSRNAPGLEQQLESQTGNFLTKMDQNSLLLMIVGVVFWAAIALGTTAGAVGVYIAICKTSGRWQYVKGMFLGGSRARLVTVPIVIAIVLMAAVMAWSALG